MEISRVVSEFTQALELDLVLLGHTLFWKERKELSHRMRECGEIRLTHKPCLAQAGDCRRVKRGKN